MAWASLCPPSLRGSDQKIRSEPDFQVQERSIACPQPCYFPLDTGTRFHSTEGFRKYESGQTRAQRALGTKMKDREGKLSLVLASPQICALGLALLVEMANAWLGGGVATAGLV